MATTKLAGASFSPDEKKLLYSSNETGIFNAFSVPVGGLLPYLGAAAPNSSFALPFGQPINRTTYATLFALIGTTFGAGDGTTTFNLPDLRGRAVFGRDNMGGAAASRIARPWRGRRRTSTRIRTSRPSPWARWLAPNCRASRRRRSNASGRRCAVRWEASATG